MAGGYEGGKPGLEISILDAFHRGKEFASVAASVIGTTQTRTNFEIHLLMLKKVYRPNRAHMGPSLLFRADTLGLFIIWHDSLPHSGR